MLRVDEISDSSDLWWFSKRRVKFIFVILESEMGLFCLICWNNRGNSGDRSTVEPLWCFTLWWWCVCGRGLYVCFNAFGVIGFQAESESSRQSTSRSSKNEAVLPGILSSSVAHMNRHASQIAASPLCWPQVSFRQPEYHEGRPLGPPGIPALREDKLRHDPWMDSVDPYLRTRTSEHACYKSNYTVSSCILST